MLSIESAFRAYIDGYLTGWELWEIAEDDGWETMQIVSTEQMVLRKHGVKMEVNI